MVSLPSVAEPLLMTFSIAFTDPTFKRVLVLLAGAILTRGRRTVSSVLWTMRGLAPGDPSSYRRVLSRARWLFWPPGKALATFLVALAEEHGVGTSLGRVGHHGQVPLGQTAIDLARGLMAVLSRGFPDKKFVFLGDGGYASHEFARWVFVRDETGNRREEYFYTTDAEFDAGTIIYYFTCRWSIETTFQEMRAHFGFETTRGRVANTILRTGPCLLGLFSVVSRIYHEHLKRHQPRLADRPNYHKTEPTFADAIAEVRRLFWTETVFQQPYFAKAIQKVPPKLKNMLLDNLCQTI